MSQVYYDPHDWDIDTDPYPTWKRLRDEAPLYYNEKYDFYAVSRFDGELDTTLGVATSVGSAVPARRWVIARAGAQGQRSTTVALSDPGLKPAQVAVAIVRNGKVERPVALRRVTIAPGQRFVLPLGGPIAGGPVGGAIVITSDVPIFAESTIYAENDATRAPGIPER